MDLIIEHHLPERYRRSAALIFEEAFGQELRLTVPDPAKRVEFLERLFDARHLVAAARRDELIGLMGLSSRHERYHGGALDVAWDPRQLRDLLGWVGAAWAQWGSRLAAHRPGEGELYIDGVAVQAGARGAGVGTRLLEEADTIARELGLRWIRLDVLDTNPRAQALYERLGFRVTRVQSFGYTQRWTGSGGLISMERPVGGPTGMRSGAAERPARG